LAACPSQRLQRVSVLSSLLIVSTLKYNFDLSINLGGLATPADVCLMMELGCDGVFVGSGIFKSSHPAQRAAAMVDACCHWRDAKTIARISRGLGNAMRGVILPQVLWQPALPIRSAQEDFHSPHELFEKQGKQDHLRLATAHVAGPDISGHESVETQHDLPITYEDTKVSSGLTTAAGVNSVTVANLPHRSALKAVGVSGRLEAKNELPEASPEPGVESSVRTARALDAPNFTPRPLTDVYRTNRAVACNGYRPSAPSQPTSMRKIVNNDKDCPLNNILPSEQKLQEDEALENISAFDLLFTPQPNWDDETTSPKSDKPAIKAPVISSPIHVVHNRSGLENLSQRLQSHALAQPAAASFAPLLHSVELPQRGRL
jgi:hypothetical protein